MATSISEPTTRKGQWGSPRCRIGFVGTGGVATRHATVLAGFDDVEVVAATDLDPARADVFAERHGGTAVPDVAALLAHGVDAAYVCVPPAAHGAAELALAEAGVALFVEKPLAADVATAERLAPRIAASGVPTRVGHHWRCAAPVRRARELLAGRRVRAVSVFWLDKVPPVPWWVHRRSSGGPLVEQAVHVLDLARVLVGEVAEVHAAAGGPVAGGDVAAATAALLRFRDGTVGTLTTTSTLGWKHRAGLEITADGLVLGVGEDWLEVRDGDGSERVEYDPWEARVAADRAFVDVLHGPRKAVTPPDGSGLPDYAEALRSHRLACALARSAERRSPETVQ